MAFGDNDLSIFFADFGDAIVYGPQSAKGNVDGPARDASFGTLRAGDVEYRVELSATAFNPFPPTGAAISIATGRFAGKYTVRSVDPLDDGATVEVKLRRT